MFGPNVRSTFSDKPGYFHHRQPEYRHLLMRVASTLRERFYISQEFDILLLTGSGTLANQAVLDSLILGELFIHPDQGEFTSRLRRLAKAVGQIDGQRLGAGVPRHYAMVAYETGEARRVTHEWPVTREVGPHGRYSPGVRFADCVSSFPFYPVPPGADVWTTVSSKQLGALPVMSIVVVRSECWKWFCPAEAKYSYLNLRRYAESYHAKYESPHTPAIALLYDLYERLQTFSLDALRATIMARHVQLTNAFPPDVVSGEGPVLTVKAEYIPLHVAAKWNLYRSAHGFQFFLYSGTDEQYEQFLDDLWRIPVNADTRVS